ncbi:MAG: FtsX-like permease family protein [Saprospiraceae bacterium]|nr:ABC transporter permease [Saprospiraceae bacterium]MDW8229723.1 FtsX-like permease family protein [Saprospiraceae bacterium]
MIHYIARKNLMHRPLNALLSWVLLSAGVAIISLLILLSEQVRRQFEANIEGIDMVMGAKGSPLQLILSAVYQIDAPTGNIRYTEAQPWMRQRLVEKAIPLAYGDSYSGYRIVGTTPDYWEHYGADLAQGRAYSEDFEAVVGAKAAQRLGLSLGSTFFSVHGTGGEGEAHEHPYRVVGILSPTGKVVDNLILCSLESVWHMHEHAEAGAEAAAQEITAVLFKFRSPMPVVQWPRRVAESTDMQLVSPEVEVSRLLGLLGVGIEALTWLGWAIVALAALSVFVALYRALEERRYELALVRTLGASRGQVLWLLLYESLWLCLAGFVAGLLISRVGLWAISQAAERELRLSAAEYGFRWAQEGGLLLIVLAIGLLAALLPAWKAYRIHIAQTLQYA